MLTVTRTFAECSPTTLNRTLETHSLLLCCYADDYTCDFATCFAGDGSGSIIRDSVTIV